MKMVLFGLGLFTFFAAVTIEPVIMAPLVATGVAVSIAVSLTIGDGLTKGEHEQPTQFLGKIIMTATMTVIVFGVLRIAFDKVLTIPLPFGMGDLKLVFEDSLVSSGVSALISTIGKDGIFKLILYMLRDRKNGQPTSQ